MRNILGLRVMCSITSTSVRDALPQDGLRLLTRALVIMTDSSVPTKRSKGELQKLVKANGGKIYQTNTAVPDTICIAERSTPLSMVWTIKYQANIS